MSETISEYEMTREENMKRNQMFLKEIGLSQDTSVRKRKANSSEKKSSTGKRDRSETPSSRYPKRELPNPNYTEEHVDTFATVTTAESKKSKGSSGVGGIEIYVHTCPKPLRNDKDELVFEDYPEFRPNLTPREVLHLGSFGGTYFRNIYSSVTGKHYEDAWKVHQLP